MTRAFFLPLALSAFFVGTSACQTEECANYVRCQNAFDDEFNAAPFDTERFEPGGDCWDQKTSSERCTRQCAQQQNELRAVAAEAEVVLEECPQAEAPSEDEE